MRWVASQILFVFLLFICRARLSLASEDYRPFGC